MTESLFELSSYAFVLCLHLITTSRLTAPTSWSIWKITLIFIFSRASSIFAGIGFWLQLLVSRRRRQGQWFYSLASINDIILLQRVPYATQAFDGALVFIISDEEERVDTLMPIIDSFIMKITPADDS